MKCLTLVLSFLILLSVFLISPVESLGIQSPELFTLKEKQPLRRNEKQKKRQQRKLEAKVNPKDKDKNKVEEESLVPAKINEEEEDLVGLTLKFVGGFSVAILSLFLFFMVSEGL